ncbi:hypothetical protein K1719_002112 [Acacia pycnantha]|nr:hypothetical protein K1719_002112 [Acacia pycnantha]
MLLTAAIAKQHLTVLHVAAGAGHVHFVKKLVNLLHKDDLALQAYNGNIDFSRAALVENLQIVQIMLQKNSLLAQIIDNVGLTALYFADLQGRNEMTWYLYDRTCICEVLAMAYGTTFNVTGSEASSSFINGINKLNNIIADHIGYASPPPHKSCFIN